MGDYRLIGSLDELEALGGELAAVTTTLGADTESSGLDRWKDSVVGFSFAPRWGLAYYVPVAHDHGTNLSAKAVADMMATLIFGGTSFAFHNAPFDVVLWARFLNDHGYSIEPWDIPVAHDTMEIAYCLGQRSEAGRDTAGGLKPLAKRFLGVDRPDFDALFPPKTKKADKRFAALDLDIALPYAAADADDVLGLISVMYPLLVQAGVEKTYALEMLLMPEVLRTEWRGLPIDTDMAKESARRCGDFAEQVEGAVKQRLSERLDRNIDEGRKGGFNLNSNDQLRALLFQPAPDGLGLPVLKKTKPSNRYPEGNPSTDESVLERLQVHEPALAWLLQMRGALKAKGTYFDTFESYCVTEDELPVLHPNYKQFGAETGRMTSSGPNVQNLPKEEIFGDSEPRPPVEPLKVNTRDMLIPRPGYYLMDADWDQVQYRVIGGFSQDPALLETFRQGVDLHRATASLMFGKPLDAVSKDERQIGKTINYAASFGAGDDRLAGLIGCTLEEAKVLHQRWEQAFPHVKVWKDSIEQFAKRHRYVETIFGRKRWLDFGGAGISEKAARAAYFAALREAVNCPVQGSEADLFKVTTLKLGPWLRAYFPEVRIVLYTHDSWTLEVPESIGPEYLRDCLRPVIEWPENFIAGWPAITADFVWGDRWGEMTGSSSRSSVTEDESIAPAVDLPVEASPVVMTLRVGADMTAEQAKALSGVIAAMPGANVLRVEVPNGGGGTLEIPSVGLGPNDGALLAHIFTEFTLTGAAPGLLTADLRAS